MIRANRVGLGRALALALALVAALAAPACRTGARPDPATATDRDTATDGDLDTRAAPGKPAPRATVAAAGAAGAAAGRSPTATRDAIAREIQRWADLARADTGTDEISVEIRQGALPILDGARAALAAGRPRLALLRLAFARTDLGAAVYVRERIAAGQNDAAGFEAEWKRVGGELGADLGRLDPRALDGVEPAALRAVAEAALPHVRLDYEASLEYGRNTMPIYGLFYLGSARAERDLVALCRSLSGPATGTAPALRGLGAELDALEGELLAAYRPPASIDRHAEFIAASSAIKEARELDAAGLRRGALLRYLQAAVRAARVRPPATFDRAALAARLRAHADRLAAAGVDHSVGQLFIEVGLDDLDAATADKPPVAAAAIAGDVVTRYLAALGPPPPPAAPRPPPRVTVTLVRWPFT